MVRLKLQIQKTLFSYDEPVCDENGNRKVESYIISCDKIEFDGDIVEIDEENKKYLDSENLKYYDNIYYGALKNIIFYINSDDGLSEFKRVKIFADPYWKLFIEIDNTWKLLIKHNCGYNLKEYIDIIKDNSLYL